MQLLWEDAGFVFEGYFMSVIINYLVAFIIILQYPFLEFCVSTSYSLTINISIPSVVVAFVIPVKPVDVI